MVLPPGADEEARRTAAHHLQVRVIKHGELNREYGDTGTVSTRVRVERVFDSTMGVRVGDELTFPVSVFVPPARRFPPISHSMDEYKSMNLLEVFFDGTPPKCYAVGDGAYYRITELTDTPTVPRPTEEEVRDILRRAEAS